MSKKVITIPQDSHVNNAIKTMADNDIGSVVVTGSKGPTGIFTERDLINKVLVPKKEALTTLLAEVMSTPLVTVEPDDGPREAAKTMIAKKNRLIVFEGSNMAGIVTATDIVGAIHKMGASLDISKIITKKVLTVDQDTTLDHVIREMYEKRIGSVLVTKNGAPQSIFTERDLLKRALARNVALTTKVVGLSSTPIITAPIEIDGKEATRIMTQKRIKRIPLVGKDGIVGIVTARDLVEALAMRP